MIDSHKHLVSRAFSKNFLRDMQSHAFEILESAGMFEDQDVKKVSDDFMPWLYSEVKTELDKFSLVTGFVESSIGIIRQNSCCGLLECQTPQRNSLC